MFIPRGNLRKFSKSCKCENIRGSRPYTFGLMCQFVYRLSFFSALLVTVSDEEYTPLPLSETVGYLKLKGLWQSKDNLGPIYQKFILDSSKNPNCIARIINGNSKRGVKTIHLNIRSLYNKVCEVKRLVKQENHHILGISEAELKKSHHSLNSVKISGYDLILPKSWETIGKARVIVFIKNSVEYEQTCMYIYR